MTKSTGIAVNGNSRLGTGIVLSAREAVWTAPTSSEASLAKRDYQAVERILGNCADEGVFSNDGDCALCPCRAECDHATGDLDTTLAGLRDAVEGFKQTKRAVMLMGAR
jgi:hypothetical protein